MFPGLYQAPLSSCHLATAKQSGERFMKQEDSQAPSRAERVVDIVGSVIEFALIIILGL